MKVHLLSLNVRGLNEGASVNLLQSYIRDCQPSLDFIAIQEHKLRGTALAAMGTRLWRHAPYFSLEATAGYGHDPADPGAGCGGVLTLLHPRWERHVGDSGYLLHN